MKKVIITQRVEIVESYNERRDCLDQRVVDFVYKCGYIPVPIPNKPEIVDLFIDVHKPVGIILTGGNSLEKYQGDAPERDIVDKSLIRLAIKRKIPLYGFCRGMQSVLDYFGNELVNVQHHVAVRHMVCGTNGEREVNSYHNQGCVKLLNESLEVSLKSNDGVIEMVRHKNYSIVGTMWHPERELEYQEFDIKLVKDLFG